MSDYQETNILNLTLTTDEGEYHIPSNDINELYFIEDIYSFSITGRLKFIDTGGLMEFSSFTGNEYFTIEWSIGGDFKKELKLYIYKVNNIEQTPGSFTIGASIIDLFLVDEYFKKLHSKYHSFTFNNQKISDIVKGICNNYLDISNFDRFENSKEKLEYYYTGMKTPAENIKWLIPRCSGVISKTPGYLFFNTTAEKNWNFCTLEQLLSKNTAKMCEPKGFDYLYSFEDTNMYYINKILEYTMKKPETSSLKKLMKGRKLGFDSKRKKFLDREFSYEDALKKFTILGKKTLFQNNLQSDAFDFDLENEFDENILDNIWYNNWIKQYCLQQTFSFIVRGHPEREIGTQIDVEWPSSNKEELLNKQFLGRYLIKSITNYFNKHNSNFFTQKLVCIKNGYQDNDSNELINAKKINLG